MPLLQNITLAKNRGLYNFFCRSSDIFGSMDKSCIIVAECEESMDKRHNISTIIMLVAGALTVLCGMLSGVPILTILKILLGVLILFLIVGKIVEKIIAKINAQVEETERLAEEEARRIAAEKEAAMQAELEEGQLVQEEEAVTGQV